MLTFIDLFAGIGGFHLAFKGKVKCVFASEIDQYALQTYEANHGMIPHGDITKIPAQHIPPHDILCAGFPCQPFSVAGKRKGFEDTRGTMFFEIARIVDYHRPKVVFLENVKGLVKHDNGKTLEVIVTTLKDFGYNVYWKVLNAKDFGLPQNRERIYIVATKEPFQFPEPQPLKLCLNDLLDDPAPEDYGKTSTGVIYYSDIRGGHNTLHSWDTNPVTFQERELCEVILKNRRSKRYGNRDGNPLSIEVLTELYPQVTLSLLIGLQVKGILKNTDQGFDFVHSKNTLGINGMYRLINPYKGIYPTLTTSNSNDFVIGSDSKPRKLSLREKARLMGFPDSFKFPVNNSQASKQLGNSVAIPVVKAIAEAIIVARREDCNMCLKEELKKFFHEKLELEECNSCCWSEISDFQDLLNLRCNCKEQDNYE